MNPYASSSPSPSPDWFLPVREGALLAIETADANLSALQRRLAPLPETEGRDVYVLDAANRFDAYAFSHTVGAPWALDRVFVSRAFTIHQLEAAVAQLVPGLVLLSPLPFFLVLGIEHLFKEETIPLWEKKHTLTKTMQSLAQRTARKLPVAVTYEPTTNPRRDWWVGIVGAACNEVRPWHPQNESTR